MYDGDNLNFLSVASFCTIKMLASDLTVASVPVFVALPEPQRLLLGR